MIFIIHLVFCIIIILGFKSAIFRFTYLYHSLDVQVCKCVNLGLRCMKI